MMDTAKSADIVARLVARLRIMVREEIRSSRMIQRRRGRVVTVNAGPPATVDVELGSSGITISGVHYLASYTPTAEDTVWVDLVDGDPLVIGKQA